MESVVMGIMIGIGIALLAAFQGIVIAALNNEPEQVENEAAVWDRRRIRNALSNKLHRKSHNTATAGVNTSVPRASGTTNKLQKPNHIPANPPKRVSSCIKRHPNSPVD
ncbi:MAG TPA: hypothetical protein ENL07_05650 [Chlorobaculum parvum]|uniref:Uncharacterized protein n=1 Tax=Chlorobaculum parvum TaxID=274539 RepID=A0A7C5DE42_9CHLB|nr:hypothetical protein [Chlorobaculum parvum]